MKKSLKFTAALCSAILLAAACPVTAYPEAVIAPELAEVMESGDFNLFNVAINRPENIVDEKVRAGSVHAARCYYEDLIYNRCELSETKVTELMTQLADSVNGNPESYIKIFMDHYKLIDPSEYDPETQTAQEIYQKKENLIWKLHSKLDKFSKSEYYKESAEKIISEENLNPSKVSYSTLTASMSGRLTADEITRLSKRDDILSLEYIKPSGSYNADYNREGKISDGICSAILDKKDYIEIFIMPSIHIIDYHKLQNEAKMLAMEYGETLDPKIYTEDEIMNMRYEYQEKIYKAMLEKAREERTVIVTESLGISPSEVTGRDDHNDCINCVLSAKELKTAVSLAMENELVRRMGTCDEWEYEIQPVATDPTVGKDENIKNGDLNGDKRINIADLVLMQLTINNDKTYSQAADMNNDGTIDVFDIILLKRVILGE